MNEFHHQVAYLKELGYDHAFNYKKTTVEAALKEAAPNGVDCYYDNVGGEMSMDVIRNMNSRSGRGCIMCTNFVYYVLG